MKTALITGISGQDGAILAKILLSKDIKVVGTFRRGDSRKLWRLEELNIKDEIILLTCDLQEQLPLLQIFDKYSPDYIYHLAGNSFVADSFEQPQRVINDSISMCINILEILKYRKSKAWMFIAGSSEIYGGNNIKRIDEKSSPMPMNPYGVAKASIESLSRIYINSYSLRLCFGILFNHESEWRSRSFVTRKISHNFARLKIDPLCSPMKLGNLDSSRDWSSAYDIVNAFYELSAQEAIGDIVLASGVLTKLRTFLEHSARYAGFDPLFCGSGLGEVLIDKATNRTLVVISEQYFRPFDIKGNVGNIDKLKKIINYSPQFDIPKIALSMVECDLKRLSNV